MAGVTQSSYVHIWTSCIYKCFNKKKKTITITIKFNKISLIRFWANLFQKILLNYKNYI